MKFVALISGGKDSIFTAMNVLVDGHELVALANLQPVCHEMDSYMYQSVGNNIVPFIAEAMELPLYQTKITGTAKVLDLEYSEQKGDEVENLYDLLLKVKQEKPQVEAVSAGAILSNYQRIRVENVAKRLGLKVFAPLWNRSQKELVQNMIDCHIDAMVVKVATMGLGYIHVGKSIKDIYNVLLECESKYHINVAGEGGEFETIVLDCPLYKKRINIKSFEIVNHDNSIISPVFYLKTNEIELVDKEDVNFHWKEIILNRK